MTVYGDTAVEDVPLTDAVFDEQTGDDVAVIDKPTVSGETAVAVVNEVKDVALAEQWPHDYLMFEGDKLGVRLPSEQALSAFSIGVSKYMPPEVQNDVVGLFIANHMSPESFTRVFARMMDPDDATYTNKTIGKLMSMLSKTSIEARKAKAEAAADDNEG